MSSTRLTASTQMGNMYTLAVKSVMLMSSPTPTMTLSTINHRGRIPVRNPSVDVENTNNAWIFGTTPRRRAMPRPHIIDTGYEPDVVVQGGPTGTWEGRFIASLPSSEPSNP